MRVWRVCREAYAADALTGRGGLFTSGRWHTRGRLVVYTSGSLALAALEVLVHTDKTTLPADLVRVGIDVPDDLVVSSLDVGALLVDWRAYPAPPELQRLGDEWLSDSRSAVLAVPSSVVPEEHNFLVNPAHADARRITVASTAPFDLDSRLRA